MYSLSFSPFLSCMSFQVLTTVKTVLHRSQNLNTFKTKQRYCPEDQHRQLWYTEYVTVKIMLGKLH